METLSLVLAVLSIVFSVGIFAVSVFFTVKLCLLDRKYKNVETLKTRAILLCSLYGEDGKYIDGRSVINTIKKEYGCDDWEALEIFSKTFRKTY